MQRLRCLFFVEARHQFQLTAIHVPGVENDLADDLSRDRLVSFRAKSGELIVCGHIMNLAPPIMLSI